MSFTEDAAFALADRSGEALSRLRALAVQPIVPIAERAERTRLSALCAELFEEGSLAREGYRLAMRGLLALIAVGVARLAASRARTGSMTCSRPTPRSRSCARWSMSISAGNVSSASTPRSSA